VASGFLVLAFMFFNEPKIYEYFFLKKTAAPIVPIKIAAKVTISIRGMGVS
jgi:hypothetical protein